MKTVPVNIKHLKFCAILFILLMLFDIDANAAINNSDIFGKLIGQYSLAVKGWETTMKNAATRLFWDLAVISMVWTFGMMALRKADIAEFFAEFVKFTIFTGFFWWLLINGPKYAQSIIDSLFQLGSKAAGIGILSPSGVVDIGFFIFAKIADQSSITSPLDSLVGFIMAGIILIVLALVAINMLMLILAGWVLAYGGIFFLGFGGSRWTSEMAINYYRTVLGVAAQLMTMILIISIGTKFVNDYVNSMSAGINVKEMAVVMIASIILVILTNKLPTMIAGIITGAGVGSVGIGGAGAGVLFGAAGTVGGALVGQAAIENARQNTNLLSAGKGATQGASKLFEAIRKGGGREGAVDLPNKISGSE